MAREFLEAEQHDQDEPSDHSEMLNLFNSTNMPEILQECQVNVALAQLQQGLEKDQ